MRITLLLAAERVCVLGMLAQMATGTRHSRPPTAPECKRPAETSCTHAGESGGTRKEPAAAVLRRPVTSLTTTDCLGKTPSMKASMACANEARPVNGRSAPHGGRVAVQAKEEQAKFGDTHGGTL